MVIFYNSLLIAYLSREGYRQCSAKESVLMVAVAIWTRESADMRKVESALDDARRAFEHQGLCASGAFRRLVAAWLSIACYRGVADDVYIFGFTGGAYGRSAEEAIK